MIRVLGAVAAPAASLAGVLERAVAGGAPAPAWVAVEDPDDAWIRAIAGVPAVERCRGVVAASTEGALVAAARLGVGGALWLPPSLAGAVAALEAAAAPGAVPAYPDAWLADLVAPPGRELVAVSWVHRSFWRCQLGEQEMVALLAALAQDLGVLPALLPWPALILEAGPSEKAIHGAWRRLTGERNLPSEGAELIPCERRQGHCGVVAAVMRSLAEWSGPPPDPASWGFPRPVHELPSGQRVGWWSPGDSGFLTGEREWVATPAEPSEAGFRWRLRPRDGPEFGVDDSLGPVGSAGAATRVPGWLAASLGAGGPAGLLVERMATAALRQGISLWVPNLRPGSLPFVLRLPGTLWVDGAGVPNGG